MYCYHGLKGTMQHRILYVVNDSGFFLSHRMPIALASLREGFDVHVACPAHQENLKTLASYGLHVHEIALKRRSFSIPTELNTIRSLYTLYKKLQPSLIHHITIKPIIYGGIAALLTKQQRVVHALTGLGTMFSNTRWWVRILRKCIECTYKITFIHPNWRVIFQNKDDAHYFQKQRLVTANQTIIIPGSGVDITHFTPRKEPEDGPITVVLAARMIFNKGIREFMKAAARFENDPNLHFMLVGSPDAANPTSISTDILQDWHTRPNATWHSHQDDIRPIFRQAHIICLPSHGGEGVPKVLIEAASMACPIITTDVPGCRDIVQHKTTGLLVPLKDVDALCRAIVELAQNKELRITMGEKARELVESGFSQEKVEQETLQLYRAML